MISAFVENDIPHFLALAEEEGWICEHWELEFLLRVFPQGCLAWRENGRTLGYITSVRYGKSGWIGNLLVDPDQRRRGIGRELMNLTVATLHANWVETVWLTASEKGAGLYGQMGFIAVDTINRWSGQGVGGRNDGAILADLALINSVDRCGWGDMRQSLINVTCGRGRTYGSPDGFICCQQWQHGTQIGPWGCIDEGQARQLLDRALAATEERVFLDVPEGNQTAAALLAARGFTVKGSNLLMYLGTEPKYRPENIFALASMGSMG